MADSIHEFASIEDALLNRLAPLKASGLKTLDAYSGQMDVDDMDELTIQFPCCYVIAPLLHFEDDNLVRKYRMPITILVGDRNVRGSKAAARGDISSPGVYAILLAARLRLNGQRILPDWTPMRLEREEALVYAPKRSLCIYAAFYDVRTVTTILP